MHVELLTNDSEQVLVTEVDCVEIAPRKRRGATAMEYLVMTSFVLVVLIIGAQQVSLVTGKMMQNNANATDFHKKGTPKGK